MDESGIKRLEKFRKVYEGFASYVRDNHPGVCFYGYGSCFSRKEGDKPPSDMDGGIIVPELITDKAQIRELSQGLDGILQSEGVNRKNVQLNLIDIKSGRDGRFLSYTRDFTHFIKQYGRIFTGDVGLKGVDNRYGILESTAFNFRSIRNGFLFSSSIAREGIESLREEVEDALGKLGSLPRKIKSLMICREYNGDKMYEVLSQSLDEKSKADDLFDFQSEFPMVDLTIPGMIVRDEIKVNRIGEEMLTDIWAMALGTFEEMIKAYIDRYPPEERVVKTLI